MPRLSPSTQTWNWRRKRGDKRRRLGQRFRRQFRHLFQAYQWQAQDLGAGFGMVAFGHQAQACQQRQQAAAGFLLQAARAHQVRVLQPAFFQQRGDDAFVGIAGIGNRLLRIGGNHCVHAALRK